MMKKYIMWESILHRILVGVFVAVVLSPVLVLILESLIAVFQGNDTFSLIIPSGRRLGLFIRTLTYSAFVGVGSMAVGIMAASFIWSSSSKHISRVIKGLFVLSIIMILVPSYVHALSWSTFFYALKSVLKVAGLGGFQVQGLFISWWVMVMALLPVSLAFSLIGFASIKSDIVEAGRTFKNDTCVFCRIIIPIALPIVALGGIFTFLLTALDYSVPSLFLVNIYSLEIFAEFSATNEPASAFLLSLPLMAISILVIYSVFSVFRNITMNSGKIYRKEILPLNFSKGFKVMQIIAICIIILQVSVPLIALLIKVGTFNNFLLSLQLSTREILFTLSLSFFASIVAIPLAVGMATKISQKRKGRLWWILTTLPLAIPAPLVGIGLIAVFTKPFIDNFYGTMMMPVAAVLVRFLPLAVIIIAVQMKTFDQNLIDAAKVFQKNTIEGFMKVKIPMMLPSLVAAFLIIFVLAAGELGATLIVVPPGYSTLTMRIYNFMHYGSSEIIAGLCLAMLIISIVFGFFAYRLVSSKKSLKRKV